MFEYKVMTQKDRYFSGKFNPEQLQAALNSYAAEGWRVVGVATGQIAQGLGSREELICFMERPLASTEPAWSAPGAQSA